MNYRVLIIDLFGQQAIAQPPGNLEGYTVGMLRYAITSGSDADRIETFIDNAHRWAKEGIAYVQLREKHLDAGKQVRLAAAMQATFREHGGHTKLLVNARADVAIAAAADGVHLTSRPGEMTAAQARQVFAAAGAGEPIVSASCHTLGDVQRAVAGRVDLILFGPVFEKRVAGEIVVAGVGLAALQETCAIADNIPVLALGGSTEANAALCVEAGAAGVAGIRLFAWPQQRNAR